jgi:hypothetical protein
MKLSKRLFILTFLFASTLNTYEIQARQIDLKIRGSIVMYDVVPVGFNLSFSGPSMMYVVKISKIISGQESSNYIFVASTKTFKKSDFKANKTIEFTLKRIKACDNKIKNYENLLTAGNGKPIPALKLSSGAKMEDMPLDETLPCYLFRSYWRFTS